MERPRNPEPGASVNAPPGFPWKEPNLDALEAESASVHARVPLQKDSRIPGKKTASKAPRNTQPGLRPVFSNRPQIYLTYSHCFRSQRNSAPPSPPRLTLLWAPLGQRKGRRAARRPPFFAYPTRLVLRPHSSASPASPLGEWFAAPRRALALALGTARAAAGTAGAQRRAGVGAARFAYAVGGAGGGGRANGRPPGATPRGAIRPPRSGPGPAPRALHFLGAF